MSNLDNAGFAIAPAAERGTNRKPVHRADDSETGGQSIRSGNLPCTGVVSSPAEVPEFPVAAMSTIAALVVVGGWFVTLRRLRPA